MANSNMYDWVADRRWNPIKGVCPHQCTYCYMRDYWPRMSPPRLDSREMFDIEKFKTDKVIFVGSGIDMWADAIPTKWLDEVIERAKEFDNSYLFQSKNPERFLEFLDRDCMSTPLVLGTTIESNRSGYSLAPCQTNRAKAMSDIKAFGCKTMVTIEPIIDFDLEEFVGIIEMCRPDWVNIGADSKGNNLPEPSYEKLQELIKRLKKFTEIREKSNIQRIKGTDLKNVQ